MTHEVNPTEIREHVTAVWAEALGLAEVDPDAGFFDLGATSHVVTEVLAKLRLTWPDLKVIDLFAQPTVNSLAGLLAASKSAHRTSVGVGVRGA